MFISSLKLTNILSFRDPPPLKLEPLNIFIGPNASGKSNLIDCIGLLQALPNNPSGYINDRGGTEKWMWNGPKRSGEAARIACDFGLDDEKLKYEIAFSPSGGTFAILRELLPPHLDRSANTIRIGSDGLPTQPNLGLVLNESVLVYRNPMDKTPITRTGRAFNGIRIYRGFHTGTRDDIRRGVSSSNPKYPLDESGSNLALALQEMDFHGSLKKVKQYLARLSSRFEDVKIRAEGALSQFYVYERGLGPISATRLSDGTLRFLCLMAVLLDHDPAPLVCIEEPEIGLHPDALAIVGDVLREASAHMQLVITTHSDALVDRFTDEPEHIVVCDRDFDESTTFNRLSSEELKEWLEEYTLGDLWRRGEIGGTKR